MSMLAPWFVPALAAVFFTAMFQGTTGFGMSLLGIPVLATLANVHTAVECMTVVSTATTASIAYSYRRHWDLKRAAWLGIPLLVATPLGVVLLKVLTDWQLMMGVGVLLLITSGTYVAMWLLGKPAADQSSAAQPAVTLYSPAACVVVGGSSGVLGGATGMTGPLLANYLIRTGISRESFKVTLNLIFTASALWRSGCYLAWGMLEHTTLLNALLLIPMAMLGTHAGIRLDKRIPAQQFIRIVHVFLLGLGIWFVLAGYHHKSN